MPPNKPLQPTPLRGAAERGRWALNGSRRVRCHRWIVNKMVQQTKEKQA